MLHIQHIRGHRIKKDEYLMRCAHCGAELIVVSINKILGPWKDKRRKEASRLIAAYFHQHSECLPERERITKAESWWLQVAMKLL